MIFTFPTLKATPKVLWPVLGCPVQETQGCSGDSPVELCKDGEETEAPLIWGKAETPGTFQLGKGSALEGALSMCENAWQEGVNTVKLGFFQWWPEAMAQNSGGFSWVPGNTFLLWGWPRTGTGWAERLWNLHPLWYSKAVQTQSWPTGPPWLRMLDQMFLPSWIILW